MNNYDVTWLGLDREHEILWDSNIWYGVLSVVNAITDANNQNADGSLYQSLTEKFPDVQWVSREKDGKSRTLFRDSREPWTQTNVLDFNSSGIVTLTDVGKKIITNELCYNDVLLEAMRSHEEHGEKPFVIIASAFAELGSNHALSFQQITGAVMRHYRPGADVLSDVLNEKFPNEITDTTVARRVKFMLKQMVQVGALIAAKNNLFFCGYSKILNKLSISYATGLAPKIEKKRNRIFFGAPGTGKSHKLDEERCKFFGEDNYERVTFYPTYTYQQFVGAYKPCVENDTDGKKQITYRFVEGPFLRLLTQAYLNPKANFLLIIEELNRANAAAVFGDTFQLLDRKKDGTSEYPVALSEDIKQYFRDNGLKLRELYLPDNFYIWTTMNSADQGVFPVDTAFKRRWDFEYLTIDRNEKQIETYSFKFNDGGYRWNDIRKAINNALIVDARVNEDKLLGPFFISLETLQNADSKEFIETFKSKVIMYLFEDAARHNPGTIFKGDRCELTYSSICDRLEHKGLNEIFKFSLKIVPDKKSSEEESQVVSQ